LDRAGPQVLLDLLPDGLPDVRDRQDPFQVEVLQVGVMAADRSGRLLVGARLVRVAARDGEELRVLVQDRLDLLVRPGHAPILWALPVRSVASAQPTR